MRSPRSPSPSLLAALLGLVVAPAAAVQADEAEEAYHDYPDAGTLEIGGTIGTAWDRDFYELSLSPTFGWFVRDGLELSLIARFQYESEDVGPGARDRTRSGALVFEPSYHHPVVEDSVYVFGGLGVGGGSDGDYGELEIIPRAGMNFMIGRSGVFSPAVRVPIMLGRGHGSTPGDFGVLPGFALEASVSTTL